MMKKLALALLLGMSLAAGYAAADTSADKKPVKKAKPGEACKTNNDCDQSSGPASCKASKCQIEMPPPPT